MSLFATKSLCILDPITGDVRSPEKFPFLVGTSEVCDWRLLRSEQAEIAIALSKNGSRYTATPKATHLYVLLDGVQIEHPVTLDGDTDYALQVGNDMLLMKITSKRDAWKKQINTSRWVVFSGTNAAQIGSYTPSELQDFLYSDPRAQQSLATPSGAKAVFPVAVAVSALQAAGRCPSLVDVDPIEPQPTHAPAASVTQGDYTCPTCWLKLDAGDVMGIATHDHLRGDPLLGPDAKLRFIPTRFNDLGQALDAMGLPCIDQACPHCRRKLPPSFLDLPNHIISLVGATSAGKSYYLCTLIKTLSSVLYKEFKLTFRDGDPTGNARLNEMKNQLFSARTPEQSFILKTDFEGIMYERLPRHGKLVALPRPFIFEVAPVKDVADASSLIFYDNAGEHFKPNVSLDDFPGALHVASSAGILFLIDPTSNPHFRTRLKGHHDPQLSLNIIDEQDTILAEMGVRIRSISGRGARSRIDTPLAIILGKCDVWEQLLGGETLLRPMQDGKLDSARIDFNSDRIRDLLLDIDPALVAVAESISSKVRFFPVSSFGHSPVMINQGPNTGKLAPDPAQMAPRMVEIPLLWVLSHITPRWIPASEPQATVA